MVYSQTEYIVSLLPSPKQESQQFQLSLQRDLIINEALENSLEYVSAKNIVISQFHNGQYDLTRLPFTKISTNYYVGQASHLPADELYGPRPLSTMNRLMLEMWKDKEKPTCVAMETQKIPDTSFKLRQEHYGNTFISLCPITNVLDYPIGYIAIGFDFTPKPIEVEALLIYQRNLTARIAGYLQEGVVKNDN